MTRVFVYIEEFEKKRTERTCKRFKDGNQEKRKKEDGIIWTAYLNL